MPRNLRLEDLQKLDAISFAISATLRDRIVRARQLGITAGALSMYSLADMSAIGATSAALLANRFGDAWRRRVMKAVIDGSSAPANEAASALSPRLRTIAVTETSKSFSGARAEAASRITPPSGMVLIKRWDAMLDACQVCASMHGSTVLASENFSIGSPGSVHPNCRCVDQYELVSAFEYYAMIA